MLRVQSPHGAWLSIVCLGALVSAGRADEGWTGKMIIVKKGGIRIGYTGNAGAPIYVEKLRHISYKVLADKDGFLKVRERGTEAWFDKNDAVLAENGVDFFTDRIRADPADAQQYVYRAEAWSLRGERDTAIRDLDDAVRLDPRNANAFLNRGIAWKSKKEYAKAIADYSECIRINPRYGQAFNNLAWLLATCPDDKYRDGKKAVELATQACTLSGWKSSNQIGTLAAAYAETGDFAQAVKYQEQALKFPDYEEQYDKNARQWLKRYEQKQPYREGK